MTEYQVAPLSQAKCPWPECMNSRQRRSGFCPGHAAVVALAAAQLDRGDERSRIIQSNEIATIIQRDAGDFIPLHARYNIADALWKLGLRFGSDIQTEGRRLLVLDLDTGEWVNGATMQPGDMSRAASAVLPGMPEPAVEAAYSEWMHGITPDSTRDEVVDALIRGSDSLVSGSRLALRPDELTRILNRAYRLGQVAPSPVDVDTLAKVVFYSDPPSNPHGPDSDLVFDEPYTKELSERARRIARAIVDAIKP